MLQTISIIDYEIEKRTKLQVRHSTELRICPSKTSETILRNLIEELAVPSTEVFRGDGDLNKNTI